MIEGTLARRYSRALFQLAREAGQEEKVGEEIESFNAVYSSSELQHVLNDPAFGLDLRKKILSEVLRTQQLSSLTVRFLSLLLDRDRLSDLAGVVSSYRRMLNQAKGRVEAKVVSPSTLAPEMVERVRAQLRSLSGKEVVLEQGVDPSLLGGLRVELEGKVYDGSLSTQLEKMKQRISRGY